MAFNNMLSELAFKFTKLADLQPKDVKNSNFRFFDNLIQDDLVHKINPSRYRFYIQFMKALKDPDTLRKMMYENRLIKYSKEEEAEIINQITTKLNQLYALPANIDKNVLANDEVYTKYKNNLIRNENDVLLKKMRNMMKTYTGDRGQNKYKYDILSAMEETFKKHDHQKAEEQVGGDVLMLKNGESSESIKGSSSDMSSFTNPSFGNTGTSNGLSLSPQPSLSAHMFGEDDKENQVAIYQKPSNTTEMVDFANSQTELYQNQQLENSGDSGEMYGPENKIESGFGNQIASNNYQQESLQNIMPVAATLAAAQTNNEQLPVEVEKNNESEMNADDMKKKIEMNKMLLEDAANNQQAEKMKYSDNVKKIKEKFKSDSILHDYRDKLKIVLDMPTTNNRIKASKLNDILIDIESNEFTSIKNVEVSKQDVIIFIGITFIIRMVCLVLVDWSMNTNFVVSYTQAYYLYIVLYAILLLILVVVVNITYNYPYYKLFMDNHSIFTTMASSLFYFYVKPGYFLSNCFRFIMHLGIIIGIAIPVVIIKEIEGKKSNEDEKLQYDFAKKKSIRKSLNTFTLIIWLFTSAIAFKIRG